MFEFIAESGPFGILSCTLGFVAFGLAAARLTQAGRCTPIAAIAGIAASSLLIGLAGTGIGLRVAEVAISAQDLTPAEAAAMWRAGVAIACSTTALGAAWAGVTALVLGLGHLPRARA